MRKRKQGRTLSRNATQRKALKRTMLVSLVKFQSIKTTLAKAKELKPFAERMITKAKRAKAGDKNSLSIVIRELKKDVPTETATELISLAKRYKNRNGGYLRIIKLAPRKSDSAEVAIVELVGNEQVVDDSKKSSNKKDKKGKTTKKTAKKATKVKKESKK